MSTTRAQDRRGAAAMSRDITAAAQQAAERTHGHFLTKDEKAAIIADAITTATATVRQERDEARSHAATVEMVSEAISDKRQEALSAGLETLSALNRMEEQRDTLATKLREAEARVKELEGDKKLLSEWGMQLEKAMRSADDCMRRIEDTRFGFDGDCGVVGLANEARGTLDAARTAIANATGTKP